MAHGIDVRCLFVPVSDYIRTILFCCFFSLCVEAIPAFSIQIIMIFPWFSYMHCSKILGSGGLVFPWRWLLPTCMFQWHRGVWVPIISAPLALVVEYPVNMIPLNQSDHRWDRLLHHRQTFLQLLLSRNIFSLSIRIPSIFTVHVWRRVTFRKSPRQFVPHMSH